MIATRRRLSKSTALDVHVSVAIVVAERRYCMIPGMSHCMLQRPMRCCGAHTGGRWNMSRCGPVHVCVPNTTGRREGGGGVTTADDYS